LILTCDVCDRRKTTETTASGLAPVSLAICQTCRIRGVENLGIVHFWIAACGGVENTPEYADRIVSWHSEKYIDWLEIVVLFVAHEAEIREQFLAEFLMKDLNYG
jgi:hypothetical protein